jgi:hypothetical protein
LHESEKLIKREAKALLKKDSPKSGEKIKTEKVNQLKKEANKSE